MNNPKAELREYLNRLIYRHLNIGSLQQQLKDIFEWKSPTRIETLSLADHFFQLVTYSVFRTVLVELSMILSEKEERSLLDWLKKAKKHAASMKPTLYNASYPGGEREPVEPQDYCAQIDNQLAQLAARKDVIGCIKTRRDKSIAHLDKAYFDDPEAIHTDYPVSSHEIDELIQIVGDILRKHHSLLFEADMRMEVMSCHNVDTLLEYARAFMRARRDSTLLDKGFRPAAYIYDNYRVKPLIDEEMD